MNRTLVSGITLFGAVALTACGSGPNVDQVRNDFDNPSGSISDQTGVVNAQAQVQGAGPGAELGSDPFAFIGGGGALTAAPAKGFRQAHAAHVLSPYFNRQLAQLRTGDHSLRRFDLTDVDADFEACAAQLESQLSNISASPGDTSIDISVELDLSCVEGFSGSMRIDAKAELEDTRIDYEMTASYDQVCYEGLCVDGDFAYEFALSLDGLGGNADLFGAWNFTVSGNGYDLTSKGGMRVAADDSSASVEYLFYVADSDGNEVSYVLRADVDASMATISVTGADGSITCTANADGSGACDGDLSWTAADIEAASRGA